MGLQSTTLRELAAVTQELNALKPHCAETQKAFEEASREVLKLSMELEASKVTLSGLQQAVESNSNIQEKLEKSSGGLRQCEDTLATLQANEAQLIAQLADRQRTILELTQNIEVLEAKVSMIETQRNGALDSKLSCALELQSANANIDDIISLQATTLRELAAVTQELNTTKPKCAEAQMTLDQYSREVLKLSMELEAKKVQVQNLSESNSKLEEQSQTLNDQLIRGQEQLNELEAALQRSKTSVEAEAQLLAQLASMQRIILELTQNNELLESKVGMIETERNNALDSKLACALESHANLETETRKLADVTQECAGVKATLEQCANEVHRLGTELNASNQSNSGLQTQLAGMQQTSEAFARANDNLQAQLQQSLERQRALEAELQQSNVKVQESLVLEGQLVAQLAGLQRTILELTQSNELWEAKVGMIETERNNALDSKLACDLSKDAVFQDNVTLQAQNAQLNQRGLELQERYSAELEDVRRNSADTQATLQSALLQNQEIRAQLQSERSELAQAREQLQTTIGQRAATHAELDRTRAEHQSQINAFEAELAQTQEQHQIQIDEIEARLAQENQEQLQSQEAEFEARLAQIQAELQSQEQLQSRINQCEGDLAQTRGTLQGTVSQRDALQTDLQRQKSNIAIGKYVTATAEKLPEFTDRLSALNECRLDDEKCGQQFFQYREDSRQHRDLTHIRTLFSALAQLNKDICELDQTPGKRKRFRTLRYGLDDDENS
jgi:chromosome segregation ATPase